MVLVGKRVVCDVCGLTKQPVGRSAPLGSHMCDWECSGYRQDPQVGSLWPGELAADFGFPVSSVGIGGGYVRLERVYKTVARATAGPVGVDANGSEVIDAE